MKPALYTILFIFCSLHGQAQKIRFSDPGNKWLIHYLSIHIVAEYNYEISYSGDTVIYGKTYRKQGGRYLRDDTIANTVLLRFPYYDTGEIVLYNYNWLPGDTVKYHLFGVPDSIAYVVDNLDSVQINSVWHKIWALKGRSPASVGYDSYFIIEGIGCTNGYFDHIERGINSTTSLMCFRNSGGTPILSHPVKMYTPPYISGSRTFDNFSSCMLGVESTDFQEKTASLFPNPVNESSRILLPDNLQSGKLTVINATGQLMVATDFHNTKELMIWNKAYMPGVYYYIVTDSTTGHVLTGTFTCL